MFLNSTIPRDAPYDFKPDWKSCLASVFKRVESHSQVDNNIRQQTRVTHTAMVCKLACGQGFEEGERILAQASAKKDVGIVNGIYYEPTHNLESGRVDSAGVEGTSSAELQGGEMQALMDQYRAQGADQFKGV